MGYPPAHDRSRTSRLTEERDSAIVAPRFPERKEEVDLRNHFGVIEKFGPR